MNCRPGDLAIQISGQKPEYIGRICTVVRVYDGILFAHYGFAWWIDVGEGKLMHCRDAALRPIRDNDGEDETFTWAGKPQVEKKIAEKLNEMKVKS